MQKFMLLALALIANSAYADTGPVRFQKEYAKVVYDVAVDGGQSVPHASIVTLPAGPNGLIITDMWVYVNTKFTETGTASLAIQCAGQQDLMAYQDMALLNQDYIVGRHLAPTAPGTTSIIVSSAQTGQIAGNAGTNSVLTDCVITSVVRGNPGDNPLTAGKYTAIIEFFRK